MKIKNFLLISVGLLLIVTNVSVSATEIDNDSFVFTYTNETEKEQVNNIEIRDATNDSQRFVSLQLGSRVSPIFSAEVWLKVNSTWGGSPVLNRY